ncbi:UDP-2,4-diacetamido-2,4,6-trideoxy-beta-L-altropyranose hydrolase [Desulfovibrio sp.]|uniref:UDP-2,4-diacetamido-2,4, 6-trideoxy-beta-L-altropyranose hydrolase n=1 Tax=Desulfovibrio sp. TaxID=885 RepID=UPI0025BE8627|nr:UDP-2,4-diacetamido-2,4,6-trideoxy-beta-L-altropyranose hydrolase [Desulfovibrio sp.]
MNTSVVICADAAPRIGTGHIMRCLALAQAARLRGITVRFACKIAVPWVRDRLLKEDIPFTEVPGEVPMTEAPADVLARWAEMPAPSWVIFDGYHFGHDCQQAVRAAGYKLMVIDDYAHLPEYSCDILLNQNMGAEKFTYIGDIGQKLLGPRYVLLRQEFFKARERARRRAFPSIPKKILITLGGGDFINFLEKIASELCLPQLKGRKVRVIQGAMSKGRIKTAFAACPASLKVLPRIDDMPALLLDTDLCITAGGSTCWELCCLGVPFLTVEVAENQHGIVTGLETMSIANQFTRDEFLKKLHGQHYKSMINDNMLQNKDFISLIFQHMV